MRGLGTWARKRREQGNARIAIVQEVVRLWKRGDTVSRCGVEMLATVQQF